MYLQLKSKLLKCGFILGAVSNLNKIPVLGPKLEGPFKELLKKQKEKLHRKVGAPATSVSSFFIRRVLK